MNAMIRRLFLAFSALSILSIWPSLSMAGQGWYVNIDNPSLKKAMYMGNQNVNCWYVDDFGAPFNISVGSIQKYTEENWSVFGGCFNGENQVQLNFLVIDENMNIGTFSVFLADEGNGAAAPQNPVTCSTDGKGEQAAIGWAWTDGSSHPNPSSPVSCSMSDGTVTATINLPTP